MKSRGARELVDYKGRFILTRSTEHGARSTQHGARSTQNGARSTQHGSISIHTSTYRSCVRIIKYIVFNGKVELRPTREFSSVCVLRAPCCVLRAACKCESTKGIHSFNFSSVLRAACKYELALTRKLRHRQTKRECRSPNSRRLKDAPPERADCPQPKNRTGTPQEGRASAARVKV